jgi:hypothetical protein
LDIVEQLEIDEIADRLMIKRNAVDQAFHNAKQKIRERLDGTYSGAKPVRRVPRRVAARRAARRGRVPGARGRRGGHAGGVPRRVPRAERTAARDRGGAPGRGRADGGRVAAARATAAPGRDPRRGRLLRRRPLPPPGQRREGEAPLPRAGERAHRRRPARPRSRRGAL